MSRKRKADDLSSLGDDDAAQMKSSSKDPPLPPLPATCWASVLNFLDYATVRSSLLVCRAMLDAVGEVDVLNITDLEGMNAFAARRFPNVSEVKVLCLFERDAATGRTISTDAAARTALFLTTFRKLKRAVVGALNREGGVDYYDERPNPTRATNYFRSDDSAPSSLMVFRGFVESFCTAFRMKMLPDDMIEVKGLVIGKKASSLCSNLHEAEDWNRSRSSQSSDRSCSLCENICATFPFAHVLRMSRSHGNVCLQDVERWNIFRARPGGQPFLESDAGAKVLRKVLLDNIESAQSTDRRRIFCVSWPGVSAYLDREAAAKLLVLSLCKNISAMKTELPSKNWINHLNKMCGGGGRRGDRLRDRKLDMRKKITDQHIDPNNRKVLGVYSWDLNSVQEMISNGFHPKVVSRQQLYLGLKSVSTEILWDKKSMLRLIEMGFAFDARDFILIDSRCFHHDL